MPIILPDASVPLMLGQRMHPDWYRLFQLFATAYNATSTESGESADTLEAMNILTARGDLLTRDADSYSRLALGTNGQHLVSDGTDALWADVVSDALVVPVESGALSSQATLDIDLGSLDMYEIDLMNVVPATASAGLTMRFSQSSSFLSGASDYQWALQASGNSIVDEADSDIDLTGALGEQANEGVQALTVRIFRPSASSFTKSTNWFGGARTITPTGFGLNGAGQLLANTNAIDGVRFLFSSGNIASGYYAARGYRFFL